MVAAKTIRRRMAPLDVGAGAAIGSVRATRPSVTMSFLTPRTIAALAVAGRRRYFTHVKHIHLTRVKRKNYGKRNCTPCARHAHHAIEDGLAPYRSAAWRGSHLETLPMRRGFHGKPSTSISAVAPACS